jgi:hypothetical protein
MKLLVPEFILNDFEVSDIWDQKANWVIELQEKEQCISFRLWQSQSRTYFPQVNAFKSSGTTAASVPAKTCGKAGLVTGLQLESQILSKIFKAILTFSSILKVPSIQCISTTFFSIFLNQVICRLANW